MSAAAPSTGSDAETDPVRYEDDSYGWVLQQVEHLRAGRREAIDMPHLAQVLSGIAAQERTKLAGALEQVLEGLLKWDHAPEARLRAWSLTIHQQRRRVSKQVRRQPGLMAAAPEVTLQAYEEARLAATRELGLDEDALPLACPYDWAQTMEREIEWLSA